MSKKKLTITELIKNKEKITKGKSPQEKVLTLSFKPASQAAK